MTETTRLRKLTVLYTLKRDGDGHPIVIGHAPTTPRDSAAILVPLLQQEPSEVFAILCLSTKRRIIAYYEVSRGTLDSTLVHPRLCWAEHKRGYVAAAVMWRGRLKFSGEPASRSMDAT